jgi:antitoxin component of MazEF toxin-antitoxin module
MLAKLTSKNQITLPKAVMDQISVAEYFEVEAVNDSIMLTPVRVEKIKMPLQQTADMESVWAHLEKLGITEQDVQDAVKWARSEPQTSA